ncbi:MAG TPA: F0F1 ATP synthase subunit gamma [Geobacteraceae bacterium]|nr:F0F1 ATP synthase subunit gamma [Geobacteraceae bacterium]
MSGSSDVEKKIRVFSDIGDIIDAMKAYAGVAIRKTEGIILNIREYERNVLLALAEVISADTAACFAVPGSAKRLLVCCGSSQGLCGAYNEKMADTVSALVKGEDSLYVIGRRLRSSLESRRIGHDAFQEFIAGVSGIEGAWRECISRLLDLYRSGGFYTLTLVFTAVAEKQAGITVENILPPGICATRDDGKRRPRPLMYLDPAALFDKLLEEYISISLYRGLVESLRSENWYRLRSMEGASENIRRHITDLESLRRYLRQEEITGEILEILGSGGFFTR